MHETRFANEIFSVLKNRFGRQVIEKVTGVNVKLSPFSHVTAQRLLETYRELAKAQGFESIYLKNEWLCFSHIAGARGLAQW